jgi:uncharacterized protein (DUF486 family)
MLHAPPRSGPTRAPRTGSPKLAAALAGRPWCLAALVAWGVAFFEYRFQVPAHRIGFTALSLPQLKILQEAIRLLVFVPLSTFYMRTPVGLDLAGRRAPNS